MKIKSIAIAALAVFAIAAQAQMAKPPVRAASEAMNEASLPSQYKGTEPKTSQNSREQVKAEAKAATADGLSGQGERSMSKNEASKQAKKPAKTSGKSRDEVKAEAKAAAAAGPAGQGERSMPKNETATK